MSKIQYATRRFTIPAGEVVETVRDSNLLTCLAATDSFFIRFDDGPENEFDAGLTYQPQNGFTRLSMRNDSAADIEVWFAFGKGEIKDSRVTISASQVLTTRQKSPDELTTGAAVAALDAAATLIAAADPLRRELIVVSPTDAAGVVFIGGDAAAGAGEGLPLMAGQSMTLESAAAVYARNDQGATIAVHVAALGWSS